MPLTENMRRLNVRKLLPLVWLLSIVTVVVLTRFLQYESSRFLGIADNSEQTISFSYPVEIVQNLVIEGAEVRQGQPILEVRRPDLSAKVTFIDDQIQAATSLHQKTVENTRAHLEELAAKRSADLAELDVQIETLRARRVLNEKLLKDISGNKAIKPFKNPIMTELRGLAEQRRHLQDSFNTQIANLKSQLESENGRFKVQIAESLDRKIELERQLSDLVVRAKFDGRIGSVNFKSGDQIAPFETILTVHGSTPLFVKGYIHENVYNQLSIGQKVWVRRYGASNDNEAIIGEVESLGSRIVEYPMRLKKNQLVSAWGREAIVRLPRTTSLLLGEKVIIAMRSPDSEMGFAGSFKRLFFGTISEAEAAPEISSNWLMHDTRPIVSKVLGIKGSAIEASGVVLRPAANELLVVNDETRGLSPHLVVMNHRGEITLSRRIAGDVGIDDIESISGDGKYIYVSASLSHNKHGKYKQERCQLFKLEPANDAFIVRDRLNLCEVLVRLAKNTEDRGTSQFLIQAFARKAIDVESHVLSKGKLYLGFKSPLDAHGNTVILQLDDLEGLFAGKLPQGRIWRRLSLLDPQNGVPAHLSDMRLEGDRLWLLGVSQVQGHANSHLWRYDLNRSKLHVIKSFPDLKAEGVSERMPDGRRVLVFDGDGKRSSRITIIQAEQ